MRRCWNRRAKIVVPLDRYESVIARIASFEMTKQYNRSAVHRFLSYRCSRQYLEQFISRRSDFISSLKIGAYLYAVSDVDLIVRLNEFGLLPEPDRLRAVSVIRRLAVDVPDAGFLSAEIRTLFTPEELIDLLKQIEVELLSNLDEHIDQWRDGYNRKDDPKTISVISAAL